MMDPSLEDVESKRRSTYAPKLSHVSEQWRASCELLDAGLYETSRTERIMLGTSIVHQARADAMQAMYMDVLFDDELNSVVDERKQKSLFERRRNLGFDSLKLEEPSWNESITTERTRRGGMLTSLVETQSLIAKKFAEDALLVTTHIAKETSVLRKELQKQVHELKQRGVVLLGHLESAENQVCEAWDEYSAAASSGVDEQGGFSSTKRRSWGVIKTTETDLSSEEEKEFLEPEQPTVDSTLSSSFSSIWKNKPYSGGSTDARKQLEIDYGVAVVHQTSLWEKHSNDVSELLESAAKVEAERQAKLTELLKDYIPGQRRLFSSAAASQTKVLEELEADDHNRLYPDTSSLLQEEKSNNDDERDDIDIFQAKEIPLTSNLVASIKVVERRHSKTKTWSRVLAVVTQDDFLHLFKLPSSSSASLSNPEKVFMELLPKNTPLFPSKTDADDEDTETSSASSGSENTKDFTPLESWFLPSCTVNVHGKNGREIEVTESRGNSRFLGRKKRLVLRTDASSSLEDKVAWMDVLRLTKKGEEPKDAATGTRV